MLATIYVKILFGYGKQNNLLKKKWAKGLQEPPGHDKNHELLMILDALGPQ